MRNSRSISDLLVIDTFEVLCAPECDIYVIKLTTSGDIPRILYIQLQPDVIIVVAEDIPLKYDFLTIVHVSRYNLDF